MTGPESIIFSIAIYKIVSLLVGLGFGFMGYRLFISGVFERAGDLKTAWGDKKLILKQAAPGTFFALFGTIVISFTIWKGMDFSSQSDLVDKLNFSQINSFRAIANNDNPLPDGVLFKIPEEFRNRAGNTG